MSGQRVRLRQAVPRGGAGRLLFLPHVPPGVSPRLLVEFLGVLGPCPRERRGVFWVTPSGGSSGSWVGGACCHCLLGVRPRHSAVSAGTAATCPWQW